MLKEETWDYNLEFQESTKSRVNSWPHEELQDFFSGIRH